MASSLKRQARRIREQIEDSRFDDLKEQAMSIGESVKAMASSAVEAAGDSLDPIETYIRERPLRSVLIAAGAGALLGFLLRR